MHSYYERNIMDDPQIDKQLRYAWRKDKYLTSEGATYLLHKTKKSLQNF